MTLPATPIRVVIVDDHAIFRSGLKADLAADIVVLAEAATVEDAIAAVNTQQPDVVLLDVHLPGGRGQGGREVIAGCTAQLATTKFLGIERFRFRGGRGLGDSGRRPRLRHKVHFRC